MNPGAMLIECLKSKSPIVKGFGITVLTVAMAAFITLVYAAIMA